MVTSAVRAYLEYSKDINCITLVSGREENLDTVLEKILKSLPLETRGRIETVVMKSIDYLENLDDSVSQDSIREELQNRFADDNNIWWIHNYHLGKNPFFTGALLDISESTAQSMVFHIHDFPECSRYPLFKRLKDHLNRDLYTYSNNVRYAVINSRDYNNLLKAGISEKRLFLLENPLNTSDEKLIPSDQTEDKLFKYFNKSFPRWNEKSGYMLYPVRAIRRKNIAEAALIALLTDHNLIVTLPGVSTTEKEYSDKCRTLFTEGLVPGMFGIGREIEKAGVSFKELIASSKIILSSSVQEGFGYLFLNSINWGKPLIARDLDMLDSFRPVFNNYESFFYSSLKIPVKLIDRNKIQELYKQKISDLKEFLSLEIRNELNHQLNEILNGEFIDFSFLPLFMQMKVIKILNNSDDLKKECLEANKRIVNLIEKFYLSDCSQRIELLKKGWSYKSYSNSTEKILHSFSRHIPRMDHQNTKTTICGSLLRNFASPSYLRLIYDE